MGKKHVKSLGLGVKGQSFTYFLLRNGQKQYFILIFALINSINHKTGPL